MSRRQIYDGAPNDSDKSFTVPALTNRHIHYASVDMTTDAAAGNRQIALEIQDASANVIFRSISGALQAASLTRQYHFSPEPVRESAFVQNQIMVPIPAKLILLPAFVIRVYDIAGIAAALDDMTVSIMVTDTPEREDNQFSG